MKIEKQESSIFIDLLKKMVIVFKENRKQNIISFGGCGTRLYLSYNDGITSGLKPILKI
ncbi:MAG TPA: hypothetical protein VIJ75_12465 [Hanamia sp.]